MGFIKGSGAYLGFYHNTLSEYFAACKIKDNSRVIYKSPNRPLWLYVPLVILFILLVAQPFIKRYVTESYWKGPNELKVNSKDLEKDSDSTFKVLKTGKIISTLSGSLHLGTFTGFSGPRGVLTGFLGMPLKKAYNRTDAEYFRHAALLFRVKSSVGSWSEYFYLDPKLHSVEENYWQFLKKGDIIQFVVNDREWQNNSGHYNIEFRICEKCKN